MTSLDSTTDGIGDEENDDLEALKALAYEGEPLEVTRNFRQQGNDAFKERRWRDAVEFYTKGIQILNEERKMKKMEKMKINGHHHEDGRDEEESNGANAEVSGVYGEDEEWKEMEEKLYLNRGACNLELRASSSPFIYISISSFLASHVLYCTYLCSFMSITPFTNIYSHSMYTEIYPIPSSNH